MLVREPSGTSKLASYLHPCWLEQEQEDDGQVVKKVIAYTSKTLSDSQCRYCTTNKELLAVVMAVELFRYYLTGWHFTVVTDHASLTWLRNLREPEGMVARWIARLQPFDFAIVHHPGKHHSHANGLLCRTSRPCKREICPECRPLRQTITSNTEVIYTFISLSTPLRWVY